MRLTASSRSACAAASLTAPAASAAIGERRRIRVIAGDVSLAREAPGPSSILNVLPARIVAMKPIDANEIVAVLALGAGRLGRAPAVARDAKVVGGARACGGQSVHAQVKAVALAPGRGELE